MKLYGLALLLGVALIWSHSANAASQTASPTTCTNVTGIGTQAWNNPGNAVSSNNAYATGSVNDNQTTNYLRCVDYGFSIPAGATIDGITVSVERRSSNTNAIRDAAMRLVKAGTIQSTDRSTGTFYPTADAYENHGGSNDLWGTTWTPADINNANFGAAFASIKPVTFGGNRTVSVDHIQITVDYTPSAVINTYYPGTASVGVGATSITLGAATGATPPIAAGDLLLVMQMQDASIDSTNSATYGDGVAGDPGSGATSTGNSGLYEYVVAANAVPLSGGTLTLSCGTINAYTNAAATGTSGQRKFQVIRVPVYASYTLVPLTAQAWNGSTGGVVAFDVTGALDLNSSSVIADGLGFRGGATTTQTSGSGANTDYRTPVTNNANGSKGEGVAGTPRYVFTAPGTLTDTGVDGYPSGSRARGAPGNAGGGATDLDPAANDQNAGGGGGANAGSGGIGGIGWCPGFTTTPPYYGCGLAAIASGVNPAGSTGGFGGAAVTGLGATRITMGGGGGGATANNITGSGACASVNGLCSSGAAGGGIIMIRAGSMSGSATFSANGSDSDTTTQNDGSGGGGGGGAVLVQSGSGMAGVTISVKGGAGGSNLIGSSGTTPHGPGGGGGGGYAITSAATASCDTSGGANGLSYYNGTAYVYGSAPGSSGSCVTSLTSAQIPGSGIGGVPACPSSLNHYAISHSGNGVNCQAEPVTITAHNASHGTVTLSSATTITLSTSTSKGDWSLVSGAGTLNNGAADDGVATYQFGNESSVILALKYTTPGSVNINVTDGTITETSGTALASEDQDLSFASSGFRFTDGTNPVTIGTQISGKESNLAPGAQNLYLQAIRTDTQTGACVGAFASGTTVNVGMASQCNNPTSCIAGQNVRITNNSTTTAIANNPNTGVSSYTSVPLRFGANSQAPFTFNYSDAGQISLHARYVIPLGSGGASSDTMIGGSAAFVVRPFGFRITDPPSGRTGGTSTAFTAAGQSFSVTLTAVAWQSADDTDNDGVPDNQSALSDNAATPNFGQETTAASATLSRVLAEPSLLNGAVSGTLSGSTTFTGFASGARTQSVNFDEVGIIDLQAITTNYLGSGQDITAGVNGLTGVGRFTPAYFNVARTEGCAVGSFTYSGQPFQVTVTAYNALNAITQNYDSALLFAKDVTISDAGNTANFSNNTFSGASAFSGGSGMRNVTYTFPTKETAPATLTLRAAEPASPSGDGISSAGHAEPAMPIWSGRVQIQNAFGSELLDLPMPARVQYFKDSNSGWVTNASDNCTGVTLAFSNPRGNLALNETCVYDTGNPGLSGVGCSVVGPLAKQFREGGVAGFNGDFNLHLQAPGLGNEGSIDVSATLAATPWLRFDWDGVAGDDDPVGRASFGIYRGSPRNIYLRERY